MDAGYIRTNIYVSPEHIKHGQQGQCGACPVAAAINSCLKPEYKAQVGKEKGYLISIEWSDRGIVHYMSSIPSVVANWVCSFDNGKEVLPFVFTLDLPERMIKF